MIPQFYSPYTSYYTDYAILDGLNKNWPSLAKILGLKNVQEIIFRIPPPPPPGIKNNFRIE